MPDQPPRRQASRPFISASGCGLTVPCLHDRLVAVGEAMKGSRVPQVYRFTIVIEADDAGGYYAFCPALPGCYSQGDTLEETKAHIREAIQCHLESLLHDGEPVPEERDELIGTVQVSVPAHHGR